jgi:hypothetical protein
MDEDVLSLDQITPIIRVYRHRNQELQELVEANRIDAFKLLSVCGKPFYVAKSRADYDHVNLCWSRTKDMVISDRFEEVLLEHLSGWRKKTTLEPKRYLERLHKEVGSPIILFRPIRVEGKGSIGDHWFELEESIPNLSKIEGFAKRYPKEQLYQDVSYWVANVMNGSPDVQPVGKPPQSDVEKVVAHGLDLKQSFRHRKVS